MVEPPLADRVVRMIDKCGIKGVKIESISKLVKAGLITRLADLWSLEGGAVALAEGFGPQSAALLVGAVQEKARAGLHDWEVLSSLGISGIGRTISKSALRLATLQELADGTVPHTALAESAEVKDVGPGRALTLVAGLAERWDDVVAISELVAIHQTKGAPAAPAALGQRYTIVVTGDLNGWDPREKFEKLLEEMGHKVTGSVSRKTSFVVTNFPRSNTNKLRDAERLGVEVISEQAAIERLGIGRPAAGREAEEVALDQL
jgi:DNA ligase (NAD+)